MMPVLSAAGGFLLILLRILLGILALLLVLILLILLLPIRYEILGRGSSEHLKAVEVRAKVDIFLGLGKVQAVLKDGTLRFYAKILSFTLRKGKRTLFSAEDSPETEIAPEKIGESPGTETDIAPEEAAEPPGTGSETSGTPEADISQNIKNTEDSQNTDNTEEPEDTENPEDVKEPEELQVPEDGKNPEDTTGSGESQGIEMTDPAEPAPISETPDIPESPDAAQLTENPENTDTEQISEEPENPDSEQISEEPEGADSHSRLDQLKSLISQMREPKNLRSFHRVKREFFRILKHILPRTLRIHGVVGTGDPASTGWILGLFYSFYPVYGGSGDYRLEGDFDRFILSGKCFAKGRIHLIVPVFSAAVLFLDGNLRRLVKKYI